MQKKKRGQTGGKKREGSHLSPHHGRRGERAGGFREMFVRDREEPRVIVEEGEMAASPGPSRESAGRGAYSPWYDEGGRVPGIDGS